MTDPVNQPRPVIRFFGQQFIRNAFQLFVIPAISALFQDHLALTAHFFRRPAMARTFQGTDGSTDAGIDICACTCDHDIGERGIVPSAMIRMKHEQSVHDPRFLHRILGASACQGQDVFRQAFVRKRIFRKTVVMII